MRAAIGPVLKFPGAKWRIADWILAHIPPHEVYVEPYFGSGAVFFRKQPSRLETINDLDGDVVNLFKVLRERRDELVEAVSLTPWARTEHTDCWASQRVGEPVEDARRFMVRLWMNHGMRLRGKGGWAHVTRQDGHGGLSKRHAQWQLLPERIAAAAPRLRAAQIENRPALDVITRYSHPRSLIYADPPYVHSTRTSIVSEGHRQYAHEMTDEEHEELLAALLDHPGPVLLSGYDHPLYRRLEDLADWSRASTCSRAEKGEKRNEVLWINPVAREALGGRLF